MKFIHDEPDFAELLQVVAGDRQLSPALVEKDYWVTHSLWALHEAGFDVWFKGGTSLSKGFALIQRFSEDLDLKIEAGKIESLPAVNWAKDGAKAMSEREAFFKAIPTALLVSGATVTLDGPNGTKWKGANVLVAYPGKFLASLNPVMSQSVKLEIGDARVTPHVPRDLSSFVHEKLLALDRIKDFTDNRCIGVRCVHPLVTLMEKLDAVQKRCLSDKEPATFVRHFEDAAHIIAAFSALPPLEDYEGVRALAEDMRAKKQIKAIPTAMLRELLPEATERWKAIEDAHEAIKPMFWGDRISISDSCTTIREWVAKELG